MNLNDRIESGKSESLENSKSSQSKQHTLNQSQNMMKNSSNTIQSSQKKSMEESIPSVENLEESQSVSLEKKVIEEQKNRIQMLSSENSNLRSELQKKSEKIVSLNEQLERLSYAELIILENDGLREENKRLMKEVEHTKADCSYQISGIKKEAEEKEKASDEYMEKAKKLEEKAIKLKNRISEEIDEESDRKIRKKINKLKDEYKTKIKGIYALLIGAIGYGFLVTILQMFLSERIKRDCKIILFKMDKVMDPFSDWIEDLFGKLWDIRNLIDNDVAGVIIAVIVYIIAVILVFLIFVAVPAVGVILLGLKYYEEIGDYVTVAFHLVLIALIVWLADFCGFIGCTMLTVWFWINVGYILVRFIIHMKINYW